MLKFSQFCSEIEEQQYNPVTKQSKPADDRFDQLKGAFEKSQERQKQYGRKPPEDFSTIPKNLLPGDTIDDYKRHMRLYGYEMMSNKEYQEFLDNEKKDKQKPGPSFEVDPDKHKLYRVGSIKTNKIMEAEYQGRDVPLNKPMAGDVKKSKVFVKNEQGNVVKVNFGDKNMTIKKNIPARRKSFRARHNCEEPGPKTKARYWSCKAW
jgi:hypothetical protein